MRKRIAPEYRNQLREVRLRALIPSQTELAKRTGLCRTTISALENNRIQLSIHHAMLIRRATGCSLDDLYEDTSSETGKRGSVKGNGADAS